MIVSIVWSNRRHGQRFTVWRAYCDTPAQSIAGALADAAVQAENTKISLAWNLVTFETTLTK